MTKDEPWPSIHLGDDEEIAGYVHPENVTLLLGMTQEALKAQLEGVHQMFSRLGNVLAQTSTLATGSVAACFWVITHPDLHQPGWVAFAIGAAALFWAASAGTAAIGMFGAEFGAPGINPRDGYNQQVLSQCRRDMQLWTIASYGGTLESGRAASQRLRRKLNLAISLLASAPFAALIVAAAATLTQVPWGRALSFLMALGS